MRCLLEGCRSLNMLRGRVRYGGSPTSNKGSSDACTTPPKALEAQDQLLEVVPQTYEGASFALYARAADDEGHATPYKDCSSCMRLDQVAHRANLSQAAAADRGQKLTDLT